MDATILKAFVILSLCVGGMGLLFYYLKKYGTKMRDNNSQVELKVLGKVSLQAKSHLFIIQAEGKKLLIGVTDNNINAISDLSDVKQINSSTIESIPNNNSIQNKPISDLSFSSFLKSVVKN